MQALFHIPNFCLDSPKPKWRGRVNKSSGIQLRPFHWKQFWAKMDEEVIPLPSADLSASDGAAPGCFRRCQGFRIQTFRALGFPWRLRNVQVVSEHWSGNLRAVFQANHHQITHKLFWAHMSTICLTARIYSVHKEKHSPSFSLHNPCPVSRPILFPRVSLWHLRCSIKRNPTKCNKFYR